MDELMKATNEIYELVRAAQDKRAEQAEEKGKKGEIPRQLHKGEYVLSMRPAKATLDEENKKKHKKVSSKLQTRSRAEVYQIIEVVSGSNYILGDIATGKRCDFK